MKKVMIVTYVPVTHADEVREVLGKAGAGTIGEYRHCSFSVVGEGRFTPSNNASPHTGKPGQPETVQEERIEVACDLNKAKVVVAAMKKAHPYEEVAFHIYPLIDEDEL